MSTNNTKKSNWKKWTGEIIIAGLITAVISVFVTNLLSPAPPPTNKTDSNSTDHSGDVFENSDSGQQNVSKGSGDQLIINKK